MNELIFAFMLFGIPSIFGFIMARKRGKNPFIWGFLSAIFPFFLMVLYMQYKPITKETGQKTPKLNSTIEKNKTA